LFDTSMIYYCLSTERCTFFMLTIVLPLLTAANMQNTFPMYKR